MRILLVNPNTSQSVTDRIETAARAACSPGTEIIAVTAPTGVPYIASRAEAALASGTVLELLAAHAPGCDAAVIAAFADPGLGGARELLSIPVVGLAEAAMLTACMLGRYFAIATFTRALGPWYRECVAANGLESRLAGVLCLDASFRDIGTVQDELEDKLVELCGHAVTAREADVIVLGGAPLAGLAKRIAARVAVPVVDSVAAAVRQAETLASLHLRKATAGTFRHPDPKPISGVSPALARLFAGE